MLLVNLHIFLFVALSMSFTNAVDLIVDSIETFSCPHGVNVTADPLPDSPGIRIAYKAESTSLASIGPDIPAHESSKMCYIFVGFHLSQKQSIKFKGIDLRAPAEINEGSSLALL